MPKYHVTADVGTLSATVEAPDEETAMAVAVAYWDTGDLFIHATFQVRPADEQDEVS
jgi:hypothetical protein